MNPRVFVDIDRIVVDGPALSARDRAELATAVSSHLSEMMTGRPGPTAADGRPRGSRSSLLGRDIAVAVARQLPAPVAATTVAPKPRPRTGQTR